MSSLHLTLEQERWLDAPEIIPRPQQLAERLCRVIRFGGEGRPCISVAAHSLTVGLLLGASGEGGEMVLLGLLHDAHETVTGDVRQPWKTAQQACVERAVQEQVLGVYGLEHLHATSRLSEADAVAGRAEAHYVGCWDAPERVQDLALSLTGLWAEAAEEHVRGVYLQRLTLLLDRYTRNREILQ